MRLKPRTTYIDGHGKRVMIAGPTPKGYFWSIGGNHYNAEGLFVFSKRVSRLVLQDYTMPDSDHNLNAEAKPIAGEWNGVAE